MNKKGVFYIVLLVVLLLLPFFSTTVVEQGTVSVIMKFGKPMRVLKNPGIYFRFPYPFNSVEKIDARLTLLSPKPSEFLTADKKNLIVDNAICYRITDPVLYLKTVRDIKGLEVRLTDLLSSHTGLILGVKDLSDIVNTDAKKIKFQEMNTHLTDLMRKDSEAFGVSIDQVLIKSIMLPYENTVAVYNRMRAERDRIAKKYIAEGEEKALKIRAEADKVSRTELANANKKAAIIMGKADAEAMKIYGDAFKRNIEFYNFIRSLDVYKKIFGEKTVIILDEKSPILKTLFTGKKNDKK